MSSQSYLCFREYEDAIDSNSLALPLSKNDITLNNNQAISFYKIKKFESALHFFNIVDSLKKKRSKPIAMKGWIEIHRNNLQKAI